MYVKNIFTCICTYIYKKIKNKIKLKNICKDIFINFCS